MKKPGIRRNKKETPLVAGRRTEDAISGGVMSNIQNMKIASPETFIPTMVDRIVRGFRPLRVVLFGAHVRGTTTKWSNVDLLVVLPNVSDKREAAINIRRALGDLPVCKDIIVTTPEEIARRGHLVGTALRSALGEGKIVYDISTSTR